MHRRLAARTHRAHHRRLAGDRPAGRSLGIAAGVLVGGAVLTWAGWQLIFWINVPVGAAALIVALKILPKDRAAPASATQFDLPGALTVIGGLAALMFGLASTDAHGWLSARTLTALSLSAVLLAAFAIIERRARRPLVAPHTWKVVTLVAGTTVMDQVRQHGDHADRWHSHLAVGHRGPLECPGRGLQSRRLADHRSGPGQLRA